MPTAPLYHVNAFTSPRARGNPAGVVLLEHEPDEEWYAATAADLNLPATAFLRPLETGYAIRWFTPTRELPVCGHATLAAARVLFSQTSAGSLELRSTTGSLAAERVSDARVGLRFPLTPTTVSAAACARVGPLAASALGCALGAVLAVAEFDRGAGNAGVVVELDGAFDLAAAVLDLSLFKRRDTHMAVVTQATGGGGGVLEVTSRVFVPFVGVDEDPVVRTLRATPQ
ncbi:putative isomerase [Vanrija pseudolonga]|uniref:Purtative isomerase n=1 Tax=Vanrija pseudolonga TaxID=143232 RepID=A0AAF1BNZ4_9TREE|nr:purtative isomerase [Vanrija pseudolonga]